MNAFHGLMTDAPYESIGHSAETLSLSPLFI